ncbi:epidermal growth factor receptor substrate 15 isoform X2 [Ascaphus truei]|uniref:epidermal growth factor receptor substrate 15 isoform X2 n=1 Tax=Ascaphus truei TaxID=8439 RepID=UPI003F593290
MCFKQDRFRYCRLWQTEERKGHPEKQQIPSNNAVYEKYFHQLESGNTGRVLAADAAFFLKKSGLMDLVLGKIWDLADTDSKGYLNKQEFFVALHLVASAQNGMDVSLGRLNVVVPPPRFHDTGSPSLVTAPASSDVPWIVKSEEKSKYDAIFDSLNPVSGFLSGDKVKPVLLNSKLSVDILGRVWELSDIDHDGLLDRDEFAVAMFLVYSALEKEPVPVSLPPALVPPSKRKASSTAASVPIIPPLPMPPSKEPRHSLPLVGIQPTKVPVTQWVVSHAEKTKYDEVFLKLDKDCDGLVSGLEVREIFLKTGLPSGLLAQIWALCDTKDCGKVSKEQFALAFHFINQKLAKGIDPPHVLTPEMIPPSERAAVAKDSLAPSPVADFSAIKELDTLHNDIVELQRDKTSVEQELSEKEEAVKQRTSEVQDLQDEVERESSNLQVLQAQRQEVQEILSGLDEQKAILEGQLEELRLKCTEEAERISSMKAEITSQETEIYTYEDKLNQAKEELSRLQEETSQLEESLQTGKGRLGPLEQELQDSQHEIHSVQMKLQELKATENHIGDQLSWCNHVQPTLVNGTADYCSLSNSSSEPANLNETTGSESPGQPEFTETTGSESLGQPEHREDMGSGSPGPPQRREITGSESPGQPEHRTYSSPIRSSPEIAQTSGGDVEEKDENLNVPVTEKVDPFGVKDSVSPHPPIPESGLDFFQSDPFVGSDPFKDDPFGKIDPFDGDPFKDSDPFASDVFFKPSSADPFVVSSADPFSTTVLDSNFTSGEAMKTNDPFAPGGTTITATREPGSEDPFASLFGNESFGTGFADFSTLSKGSSADPFDATLSSKERETFSSKNMFEDEPSQIEDPPPALPPKTGTPTRPCPPPPGQRPHSRKRDSPDSFRLSDPFQPFSLSFPKEAESDLSSPSKETDEAGSLNNFNTYQTEDDLMEWAKRESEREEEERLARLKQQEQEDFELAIALSKSEISEA